MSAQLPWLPVHQPSIGEAERAAVQSCIEAGEISGNSPVVGRFEEAFAAAAGLDHAVATTSGTTALHLALATLGVGPGDEVIVPTLTFAACTDVVTLTGATAVHVEVERPTGCLAVAAVEAALSPRTRAVMAVHLFGCPADLGALASLCHERGVALVEVCAQALGARFVGNAVGSFGAMACYSLYANKHVTAGEGGVLACNDEAVAARARHLRNHAIVRGGRPYWHDEAAFNFRLGALNAALATAQVGRLQAFLDARKSAHRRYAQGLVEVPGVRLVAEHVPAQRLAGGGEHAHWAHVITVDPAESGTTAAGLGTALRSQQIDTRRVFSPLHQHPPATVDRPAASMPVAERWAERGLILPSGNTLTAADVDRVVATIRAVVDDAR